MLHDFAETFPCLPTHVSHPGLSPVHPSNPTSIRKTSLPRPLLGLCGGRLAFTPALVRGDVFRLRAARSPPPPSRPRLCHENNFIQWELPSASKHPILEVGLSP